MAQILNEIVAAKKVELDRLKVDVPLPEVERRIGETKPPLNLAGALWSDSVRVIAEVKRASPAKGLLRADLDPAALASSYADNGAAAVSVLTNKDHFQGSIEDLEAVHGAVNPRGIPVLRKEFVFDPYQVYEARAHGADAVLLIVAMLDPGLLGELRSLTQELWMQSLVEVHDQAQLEQALAVDAEIIGINNRDLRTFKTDLEVTERPCSRRPGRQDRRQRERREQPGEHRPRQGRGRPRGPGRRGPSDSRRPRRKAQGTHMTHLRHSRARRPLHLRHSREACPRPRSGSGNPSPTSVTPAPCVYPSPTPPYGAQPAAYAIRGAAPSRRGGFETRPSARPNQAAIST